MSQKRRLIKLWNKLEASEEDDMAKRERRSCHYCGVGMTKRGTKEPRSATIDHIIPKSRGGNSSPINTVMCCRKCNNEKGNFTGVEYRAWIKAARPNKAVFKSEIPDFRDTFFNNQTGSHYDWFVKLYVTGTNS